MCRIPWRWALFPFVLVAGWAQAPAAGPQATLRQLLDRGECIQAEQAARDALADLEQRNLADTLDAAHTLDLLVEAQIENTSSQSRVEGELNRAIAIKSKVLGERHPDVAVSLNLLATFKRFATDYAGAAKVLEQAKAIQEQAPQTPAGERADVLANIGEVIQDRGRYAEALPYLKQALAMREKEFGPASAPVANTLTWLGVNGWQTGRMAEAKELIERAIRIDEAVLGPDHPETAHAIGSLGAVLKLTGNFPAAKLQYERAAAIYEKRLGPFAPRLGVQLNNLGLCLKELDEYERAGQLLERASAIFATALGPDHSKTATAVANTGIIYQALGDLPRARQAYEKALVIQEKRLGPDHPLVGAALTSMGIVNKQLGDYPEAKRCLTRALEIYRSKTGMENPKTVDVAVNLGEALLAMGESAEAIRLFEQAVVLRTKILGPDKSGLAGSLTDLSQALFERREYPVARRHLEQALAIYQKEFGLNHHATANTLSDLAKVATAQGDYSPAERYADQAVAGFRKSLGDKSPSLAYALRVQAEVKGRLGHRPEALQAALASAGIWQEHVRLTLRSTPERLALLFVASGNQGLDVALSLASDSQPLGSAARRDLWDAVIRDRALALDEMAERHRTASAAADPATAALEGNLSSARTTLARLVVQGPRAAAADYPARLEHARQAVEHAENLLAEKVIDFRRELALRREGYPEVAAALPAGTAMVAFVRYSRTQWPKAGAPAVPSYLAFVQRSGQDSPAAVQLGSVAAIDKLVADWRREIHREADSMGRNAQANEQSYRAAGSALRRAVWDPLAVPLRGATGVFVVPDGSLQLVNLNTLPVGAKSYLAESRIVLHTLSAERDLAEPPRASHTTGMLALGNPAYQTAPSVRQPLLLSKATFRGARSHCTDFTSLRFEPLPASGVEARTVLNIWAATGETGESLIGAAATEAAFKEHAPGKRVIHLATHGFFLDEQCGGNAAVRENPLLRAGLVLAGANRRQAAGPGEEDGILTAEEVASLNLQGTELVVLSGCDTGTGEVRAGEGVLGLRRAFKIAGVDTLISSLWPVADDAARDWMASFYRSRFQKGRATAESMRDAMRAQLQQRRAQGAGTHPFYWGSFLAVGDSQSR